MIIDLPKHTWELLRDSIADVACWHMGFAAAKPESEQPPQVRQLIDIGGLIKSAINFEVNIKGDVK